MMMSSAARRLWSGSALLVIGLFASAADAGATLRVASHNDPAGDPTPITYRLDSPTWTREPIQFALTDGESRSFGPKPGTYTVQALPPSGWRVNDIQCVGLDPGQFVIDVANGLVTVTHGVSSEQTCSFTNGKVNASGPPSSGIAPSPPSDELPKVKLPREIALLGVHAGKGFVKARLRIIRRSTISLQLRRGKRMLAFNRVSRRPGVRSARIELRPGTRRRFRNHGRERVEFTLRIKVAERRGTTKVLRYRVLVPV